MEVGLAASSIGAEWNPPDTFAGVILVRASSALTTLIRTIYFAVKHPQCLWFLESLNRGAYPKPCRYYRLSLRGMCGGKAGLKVFFLGRQQWSMSSLHTCSLLPSHCSLALDLLPDPSALVSQTGEGGFCSCSAWMQLLRCTLPSDQKREPGHVTHSVCLASPFQGVELLSRVRGRFPHNIFPSLKWE